MSFFSKKSIFRSIFIVGESDEWHKWDLKAPDKHQARKMTDQINLAKHCAPRGVGGVERRYAFLSFIARVLSKGSVVL